MKNVLILLSVFVLVACKQEQKETSEDHSITQKSTAKKNITTKEPLPDKLDKQLLLGEWKGSFGNKEIHFEFEKIENDIIYGSNTVGNNSRNVKGAYSINSSNSIITASLNEPGDNKYDGVFKMTFNLANLKATGKWEIFNGNSTKKLTVVKTDTNTKPLAASPSSDSNLINSVKEDVFVSDESDFTLVGKWHGIYGNHDYDWYVRIDSIDDKNVYGMAKDGLYETLYKVEGSYINNNGIYSGDFTELKFMNGRGGNKSNINLTFDVNKRTGLYNNIKLEKYPTTVNGLLKDVKGVWEGDYRDSRDNREHLKLVIDKVTNSSIFGYTIMKSEKNGTRKKAFKGAYQKREDSYNSNIAISVKEEDYNGEKNETFIDNGKFNLRYLNGNIDGVWTINNINLKVELKKPKRIYQTPQRIKEINDNITELEVLSVNLFELYDEILRGNTLTINSSIRKSKIQLKKIGKFTSTHSIPNDKSQLTHEQEERMENIKSMILQYQMNSKLQRRLNGAN